MDLLDFARGPALRFAMAVFVLGVAWRLIGVLLLPRIGDRSPAREGAPPAAMAALGTVLRRMWPRRDIFPRTVFTTVNSFVFHLGLAVVVFGLAAHIVFLRDLLGLHWPALPSNLVFAVAVVTLASLLGALVFRVSSPVTRLITRRSDYLSWLLTFLPVLTGLLATAHLGARYETLLAIHLLSIAAFLVWFPFGMLMHAVLFAFSRGATGIRFSHRGVKV
ncbi:nitrate reductase [Ideonella sp. 4Y11]|uniref:Nitrate reductase n=1 Tax=Ideonella aquatica TaxID=2824119 RepID=A0A941BQW9_9BURK|nr:nitrate reductase [Ideonella aquatica]MBQ0959625.1 nitrate reductase [Ideonella aquatica]